MTFKLASGIHLFCFVLVALSAGVWLHICGGFHQEAEDISMGKAHEAHAREDGIHCHPDTDCTQQRDRGQRHCSQVSNVHTLWKISNQRPYQTSKETTVKWTRSAIGTMLNEYQSE